MLNRDQILQAQDLPHIDVEVPEWGGTVRVRAMTGHAREQYEEAYLGIAKSEANIRAAMCAYSLVDDNGELLFTLDDIAALGKKSAKALMRVFEAAQKLNAVGDSEAQEKN